MPAITVGLEEVERRVRQLRRRLNAVTLQHCIYLSVSAAMLLCAALLCVGLQASAATFRLAWWLGAAALAVTLAWCAFTLRARWLNREAAGWLADRRGQLGDRLTTLLALRGRPRTSSLAPVLLAQTLGLGERWQPKKIAPQRVPRSVFAMIASVAVFTLVFFFAPNPPPAPAAVKAPATDGVSQNQDQEDEAGRKGGSDEHRAGDDRKQEDTQAAGGSGSAGQLPQPDAASASGSRPPAASVGALARIPDRVQQALRQTFRARATDRARGLGSKPRRGHGGPGTDRSRTAANRTQQRNDEKARGAQNPSAEKRPGNSKRTQKGAAKVARNSGKKDAGGRPGTGAGSGPLQSQAVGKDGSAETASLKEGTFKVTLNSFLNAVPQPRPRPGGTDGTDSGGRGTSGGGERELSERQMGDDALRKALVPAEYEGVVRRIYLSRAQR
jgi:hypothetical protein